MLVVDQVAKTRGKMGKLYIQDIADISKIPPKHHILLHRISCKTAAGFTHHQITRCFEPQWFPRQSIPCEEPQTAQVLTAVG